MDNGKSREYVIARHISLWYYCYYRISYIVNFIKKVINFDPIDNLDKNFYLSLNEIYKINEDINIEIPKLKISRKDPACIIYTSGTQGNPKGVVLSHGGILNNCEGGYELLKPLISKQTRFLTWLPLSHSYEHTVQFIQIAVAAKVFYAESIDKLIENMSDCSPQIMTAVPRFYQNLYQKINASFNKATGLKKELINQTLKLGSKKVQKKNLLFLRRF